MDVSRLRYWNEKYFEALGIIEEAAKKEGLTLVEVRILQCSLGLYRVWSDHSRSLSVLVILQTALRWLNHHSVLKRCVS